MKGAVVNANKLICSIAYPMISTCWFQLQLAINEVPFSYGALQPFVRQFAMTSEPDNWRNSEKRLSPLDLVGRTANSSVKVGRQRLGPSLEADFRG